MTLGGPPRTAPRGGLGSGRQRDGLSAHPGQELHQLAAEIAAREAQEGTQRDLLRRRDAFLAAERTWPRLCVIVVGCDTSASETPRAWLAAAMHEGKAHLLPRVLVEVEARIGGTGAWRRDGRLECPRRLAQPRARGERSSTRWQGRTPHRR